MITKVSVHNEPGRNLPWIVRWFGDYDPVTGKQRRYSRAFRHSREAKVFQCDKQAELNHGGPRDRPDDVTLGRLLDEFEEARVRRLNSGTQSGYKNSLGQLREHFGNHRPIRQINQRQAEVFMSNRKRRDGRTGELSGHTRQKHLVNCRAAFNAAIAWGYLDRNPFAPPQGVGQSSLRIKAKSAPWII
ncbi:MAG: phage integrase SAM-like domain-containing protein [Planctomycetes bacterium]|nr:phage integrase SAM-like domain-containing protein [Planctomycetota bacterium]